MKLLYSIRNWIFKLFTEFGFNFNNTIYYINGTEKLPPPLSAEEEWRLLEKYDGTDRKIKDILITHNLRLVVYISKKFDSSASNIEDLISIGTIGLIKAVNTFRPDKNIKLATYASRCIENEILMHLRKVQRTKTEVSIDEPINIDGEGNDLSLVDILGSDNDVIYKEVEESDNKKVLKRAIMNLNEREKTIMELRSCVALDDDFFEAFFNNIVTTRTK
jgi:RNA polymerase sporulation-specific sigma factor